MIIRRPVPSIPLLSALLSLLLAISLVTPVRADDTAQPLPFSQAWEDGGLITADDDWSGVPGIIGYRGDGLTSANDVDPRTVTADGAATPVDVIEGSSAGSTAGGVHELETEGVVALQGSGTADAPHLVIRVVTTGQSGIAVDYSAVELDTSDAVQQVATQYRVGTTGDFTDLPAGYIADASDGTGLSTPVSVTLPAAADDQASVDIRIITTNAGSSDSMIGIDDISVSSGAGPAVTINEVRHSQSGADSDYVEITGPADEDLSDLSLVILSGEFAPGQVDFAFDLAGTMPPDGFYVLGEDPGVDNIDLDTDADFFGSPVTYLLVTGFTGAAGEDYDTNDDGTLDSEPWTAVVDAVSFIDGDATPDLSYADTAVPGDGSFVTAHAYRCPDGTGDFEPGSFSDLTADTPGEANDCGGGPGGLDGTPVAIHDVQGDGAASPLDGDTVEVTGIVTSLFTDDDMLDAFFLQEEDADADTDAATSEGVFVFCRGFCPVDLAVGDQVTVDAVVDEFFGMTQLEPSGAVDLAIVSSGNELPPAVPVAMPAGGSTEAEATFEAVEGMVVTFPDTLVVSEYFELARYGQVVLTESARPFQFTHVSAPDVAGYQAFLDDLATRRIILDDDNNDQNDATNGATDEPYPFPSASWPTGGLSVDNTLRGGQTIDDLTGVMHWSFAGQTGTDAWRIRPIDGLAYTFADVEPRQDQPDDVGGDLTVASFNVLNYFPTIDDGVNVCPDPTVGDDAGCRGADSEAELDRQQAKIVAALAEMDADVVGLIEIENSALAVQDLVDALNGVVGAGTYAQIDTGPIGTDAIKVGFIYQPATVAPVGDSAILDSSVDARFVDSKNRPMLVQTFSEVATGEVFTAAVNHLKSKGSDCADIGEDESIVDGQANCSETRNDAAAAIADFLATDPTGSGDPDVLILGDLNAYRNEDAIVTLENAGFADLLETEIGEDAYTYLFDGQLGYLDYAMANSPMADQVTGVTSWHINADEVPLLDYNDTVEDATERSFERKSDALPLFAPDAFRSSDHDPVIVGLDLGDDPIDPGPTDPGPTDPGPTDPNPVDPDPNDGVINLLPEDPAQTDNTALSVLGSQLVNPDNGALAGTDVEVLIASDVVFADALASGAIQTGGTSLLLNNPDTLENAVLAELRRLGATQVRILGGVAAISQAVEEELVTSGFAVSRTAGETRVETALEISSLALTATAGMGPDTGTDTETDTGTDTDTTTDSILARAYPTGDADPTQAFADSLAVGAYGAVGGTPILLTQPDVLTASTDAYLAASEIESTTVIGGIDAVAEAVTDRLTELGVASTRVSGPNRFATAVAIANIRGFDAENPAQRIIVLEGQGDNAWAAGFTLAGLSAASDAPIVLVNGDDVPPETQAFLDAAFDPADDGGTIICAASEAACDAVVASAGL
ncbi:ExeM/NucH family extracellular endonuclease [Euzebya tangerina]|uniref:ExeM/NucH family extracellular endonuclease n=1 Tax=Euzebya tangerina TaxID=591198 RepID=UPI000E3134F2|nr:ExeM/NucH family extracellular endonuclease [Euzebya tangerina]